MAVLGRKALGLKAAWRTDEKILDILSADVVVAGVVVVLVVDVEEMRGEIRTGRGRMRRDEQQLFRERILWGWFATSGRGCWIGSVQSSIDRPGSGEAFCTRLPAAVE